MADPNWPPERLFRACCDGTDATAWDEFRRRYGEHIRGVAFRVARRWGFEYMHEDFVKDVYAKFCSKDFGPLRRFVPQHESSDIAYVRVVTANEVSGLCKSAASRPDQGSKAVVLEPGAPFPAPGDGLERQLLLADAETQLKKELPPKNIDRDLLIFRSYYLLGLTAPQIASLRSISLEVAGIEAVLYRCRKILVDQQGKPGPQRYRKQNDSA